MKASYAVTSDGQIIDARKVPNVFSVRNLQMRVEEIKSFIVDLACALQISPDSFSFKFQPFYTEDHVLFLYKVPLEASNALVRKAYDLRTGKRSMKLIPPADYTLLKSIYSEEVREKTQWYALFVQDIVLERNLFDCSWEQMTPLRAVPFYEFERQSEYNLITPEQLRQGTGNRAYYYPSGIPTADSAKDAAMIVGGNIRPKNVDEKVLPALKQIYLRYGLNNKCCYGNRVFYCLYSINDLRFTGKIFSVYQELKDIIKSVYPQAFNIRYNDNQITYEVDGEQHTVYVCAPITKQQLITFVVNGAILHSAAAFKEYLQTPAQPCRWFEEMVLPNIDGKDNQNGKHRSCDERDTCPRNRGN